MDELMLKCLFDRLGNAGRGVCSISPGIEAIIVKQWSKVGLAEIPHGHEDNDAPPCCLATKWRRLWDKTKGDCWDEARSLAMAAVR